MKAPIPIKIIVFPRKKINNLNNKNIKMQKIK